LEFCETHLNYFVTKNIKYNYLYSFAELILAILLRNLSILIFEILSELNYLAEVYISYLYYDFLWYDFRVMLF